MWLGFGPCKHICKFDTRLTKFKTHVVAPSSWQAWFHTSWTIERADPTHLAYNPSNKLMKVEDGNAEVLRVEMKEGNGNFEGVMNDILFFLPIIEDDNGMLFQIC